MGLVLSGCRQDMHNQPKFVPLRSSEFFPDRRSARYPVPGTIAQLPDPAVDAAQLDPDSYLLSGRRNGVLENDLPDPLKSMALKDVLTRGQERYDIYCTPCHSLIGDGNGMVVQRGYKRPPSFHQDRLRNAPLGHFFDVISNGFGAMPDYSAQIKPEDRWAIAAYIRALQLSQHARETDVAEKDRAQLKGPTSDQIQIPPTSKNSLQPAPESPAGGVKR
ncbi:MAG TPA: cytochrome c [Candidatus Angelobacter sp.]|nr:cytochrome c [Candidatus Angelobacter sp.]